MKRTDARTRLGGILGWARWPGVIAWIALIVAIHPFAGSLYEISDEGAGANLPTSAESTRVLGLLGRQHNTRQADTAAVVFESDAPLNRGSLIAIRQAKDAVFDLAGHVAGLGSPGAIRLSADRRAALFTVTISAPRLEQTSLDTTAVAALRAATAPASTQLRVYVTGPAAVTAAEGDTSQTTLLVTALLIVGAVLILTFGGALLWVLPLLGSLAGIVVAQATVHLMGEHLVTVTPLSTSILIVLTFGASSDYALLLIHRYREELGRHARAEDAMAHTLCATMPTLLASGGTVVGAMLCLLAARSAALSGLGPVAAVSIVAALGGQITFLPLLLLLFGRRVFWPAESIPAEQPSSRLWLRVAAFVEHAPRRLLIIGGLVLVLGCSGIACIHLDDDPLANVRGKPEAVLGAAVVSRHFGAGVAAPLTVLTPRERAVPTAEALNRLAVVKDVEHREAVGRYEKLTVTLRVDPYSALGRAALDEVRATVHAEDSRAMVGGEAAIGADVSTAARRDAMLLIPLILLVVFLVVSLLLRSLVAPLIIVLATVLSFGASLGVAALAWSHLFDFNGIEAQLPMYLFVFLVALGVDYSIFLAARIREESQSLGTTAGTRKGLAETGSVITSAGIVLAGTFLALTFSTRVDLTEVGSAIGIGVLIDTLLVRTILVPAFFFALGRRIWWPSRRDSKPHDDSPRFGLDPRAGDLE